MSLRPAQVALDLGTPPGSARTSSDFEEINYPPTQRTKAPTPPSDYRQEELPLHYMTEDSARRRVVRTNAGAGASNGHSYDYGSVPEKGSAYDDDGGKDVYAKMNVNKAGGMGGGRIRRPPPPPATSMVRLSLC
jgi:dolichyl-phosphate-mannose-protein mannosyltransferase